MRLMVLLARWRPWRWLRSLWLWWALLLVLGLLLPPGAASPASMPVSAASGGMEPLLALGPAMPAVAHAAQQPTGCGVTDLTSCINDWINSFTKNTIADWLNMQVGNLANLLFIFHTPDQLTYHAPLCNGSC